VTLTASAATTTDWIAKTKELAADFATRAAEHDADDTFVAENYAKLREAKLFSAPVPAELGGGGATFAQHCEMIRTLGRACGSTALAYSMHSHLLQALIWRHRHAAVPPAEPLLRRIAKDEVVLVSTGGSDWLEGSGLTLDNGVVCDETLLAAPGIVAAGDVARWPNPMFDGELMRLEHWTNAAEQGVAAARRLLVPEGETPVPYAPVPFVWSDQYDRKIQTVGHYRGDDDMEVVHGTLEERRFVAVFGRNGRLVGALGFSMPAKVMQYRKMIEERASFEDALERARAS